MNDKDKKQQIRNKPFFSFNDLYQKFLDNGKIKEVDNPKNMPKHMILALEKMKFDRFLIDNKISKPNKDGYYTGHEHHYTINNYDLYLDELKKDKDFEDYVMENNKTKQPVEVTADEVKKELHNHIFKGNAFEVWQSMFDRFNINETTRTDLRFMYEVMKYNNQIHKSVTLKIITDWINETYQFAIEKLQYTDIKSKANEKRMSIYNLMK